MKPIIYRITHLWPNKQPGQGLTAQIEQDQERWTIGVCSRCRLPLEGNARTGGYCLCSAEDFEDDELGEVSIEVIAKPDDSSTVQIKPETDELNALPSRFVSLQDYERLEREQR